MSDDLVKRLRDEKMGCNLWCEYYDGIRTIPLCIEAADRIEKLTTALRDLSDGWDCCPVSQAMRRVAREALEGKDGE
jgi:hypothetical protein